MKLSPLYLCARLFSIAIVAALLGFMQGRRNYDNYWNKTIRRVQTVDFNLLYHVLPTKLSYALIERDIDEIQRTLNSSHGFFGMVVTDCMKTEKTCSNQNILYSTNTEASYERRWKQELDVDKLLDLPYSILKNPPPLLTETKFDSSRNEQPKSTGNINEGEVIGRVYYVRGVPPKYTDDLKYWVKDSWEKSSFSDSGANVRYTYTFILFFVGGIATFLAVEFLQVIRRGQQREKVKLSESFKKQKVQWGKKEKNLTKEINKLNQNIEENEHQLQQYEQREQQLNNELEEIQEDFNLFQIEKENYIRIFLEQQSSLETSLELETQVILDFEELISVQDQQNEVELRQLHQQKREVETRKSQIQEEILGYQNSIGKLKAQIDSEKTNADSNIKSKEKELKNTREKIQQLQESNNSQEKSIVDLKNERDTDKKKIIDCEQQQKELIEYTDSLNKKLEDEICTLNKNELKLVSDYDDLQSKCAELEDKIFKLESESEDSSKRQKRISAHNNKKHKKALKFGNKRLILVGGHKNVHSRVFEKLCLNNELKSYDVIPPSNRERISIKNVKSKITNADLVAVITGYIGHDLSNIINDLKNVPRGEVIWLQCRGSSGIIREIEDHLIKQCHNNK